MAMQPTASWHGPGFESRLPAARHLNGEGRILGNIPPVFSALHFCSEEAEDSPAGASVTPRRPGCSPNQQAFAPLGERLRWERSSCSVR